ncbi:hypothetical protein HanPSC8_Chr02g0065931 [Helianthus annuus]|nr:hypothetical protein HanPSC8_Chr02g0065931 [Helianthus annuus]
MIICRPGHSQDILLKEPSSDLPWSLCCTKVLTCSPGSLAL